MNAGVGAAIAGLGALVIYEGVQHFRTPSASAAGSSPVASPATTGGASAASPPGGAGQFVDSPGGGSLLGAGGLSGGTGGGPAGSAADIQYNVTTLAAWAKRNGIDPRIALAIMAGESGGRSDAQTVNSLGLTDAGPLQIDSIHQHEMPGIWPAWAQNILNDIQIVASRWLANLRGLSWSTFQQDPGLYWANAQGADLAGTRREAARQNIVGQALSWCQQYGVC